MSEKEYKEKTENMFAKNTVLINENERLKVRIEELENDNKALANNVVKLGEIIKKKEKLWKHLESRFVEVCKTCTSEEKAHCVMFPEYCEGECTEIIDLLGLLEKATEEGNVK